MRSKQSGTVALILKCYQTPLFFFFSLKGRKVTTTGKLYYFLCLSEKKNHIILWKCAEVTDFVKESICLSTGLLDWPL